MPINVGEQDFVTVADAAHAAARLGDADLAWRLDKMARKINADVTSQNTRDAAQVSRAFGGSAKKISWKDVPSVFDGMESLYPCLASNADKD